MIGVGLKTGAFALMMGLALSVAAPSVHAEPAPRTQRLTENGPYGSGSATLPIQRPFVVGQTTSVRTLTTKVWYPAKDDAAKDLGNAVPGKSKDGFPLIVYGHGLGSVETDIAHVATHLASHGYVVASIRFPNSSALLPDGRPRGAGDPAPSSGDVVGQVGDMLFVAGYLVNDNVQKIYPFAASIDETRTGLMGYSLGGVTAAFAAEQITKVPGLNPSVKAVATFAPAACGAYFLPAGLTVSLPLLVLNGDTDAITPAELNGDLLYSNAYAGPKYLVHLERGSHGGFIDTATALEAAAAQYTSAGFPVNMDGVICTKLAGTVPAAEQQACQVCTANKVTPQLSAVRQQTLQKASVLAFFDGYLRDERRDQQYLKTGLEGENPELSVTYIGPENQ